jgi:hypothetical protein
MSSNIYKKAIFRGHEVTFEVPSSGQEVDIDFDGHYLIQIKNDDGTMRPTGNAINGWGEPIAFKQDEIVFEDNEVTHKTS